MRKKLFAEFLGTFWLVFGGCGSALFAAAFPELGIGFVGVSIAFGLTVVAMAYGIGHISGAHLNPAVTIGLSISGRHSKKEILPYIFSQVFGAVVSASLLFIILNGSDSFSVGGFASNGYGELSPGGYNLTSVFLAEAVLTYFFLLVILGATDKGAPQGFAGLAIGLTLTLIHLVSIPISNTSVNPARSISQAIFAETAALSQVWLFLVAPVLGAILAGFSYKYLFEKNK
ncbi:aquaporin Z [Belliella sp. R4-6]|uniref:Aquaporin Z n=1 Tax=Belliella alkalica TaxID=1730871 RepID=A0ABS9VF39_9BACT|nr:aquaporin Z [Belliella alkalica]MCH7415018.1 aquaporin Z [Belliella alkalica]